MYTAISTRVYTTHTRCCTQGFSEMMLAHPELTMAALMLHNDIIHKARWDHFGFIVGREGGEVAVRSLVPQPRSLNVLLPLLQIRSPSCLAIPATPSSSALSRRSCLRPQPGLQAYLKMGLSAGGHPPVHLKQEAAGGRPKHHSQPLPHSRPL